MAIGISALAYAVRTLSAALPKPLILGHAQQLAVAALGYKSLAAYQASKEEQQDLSDTRHILVDEELVVQRAEELGLGREREDLTTLVCEAFEQALPKVRVHRSLDAFEDAMRVFIDDRVLNHDRTTSQMAMTNGTLKEIYLPFEVALEDIPFDSFGEFPIEGHIGMAQDWKRPYSGNIVNVSATLRLIRYGRVCVGQPECEVTTAKLDFNWSRESDEDDGDAPTVSLAQALSDELGVTAEEAELLADCEIWSNDSDDGLTYSYILQAEQLASPELAEKLLKKFGSFDIALPASFYDNVHWAARDL